MKSKWPLLLILILTLSILGCSRQWTDKLRSGEISEEQFSETVSIQKKLDLVFVPVTIEGEEYNFLFDTGAPLGISKKLQEKFNFKVISKSHIRDTDQNRQQVQCPLYV